jgi:hypothetical protein
MQFKHEKTLEEWKIDFKERVRVRANNKFNNIYPDRESSEDFITAIQRLATGQAIPAAITTRFIEVQDLRTAQTTAIAAINAATTLLQCRAAWQSFTATVQTI